MSAAAHAAPARRALVTGGASGIGAAVARRLAQAGRSVVIADLDGALGARVAEDIGASALALDVTDGARVRDAVARAGPFAILVNCAGADQHALFTDTGPAEWRRLLAANLDSVLVCTHAVLPGMRAAGYGRIVNVSSEAGRLGSRGAAVYAAAKGGVIAFTRSIARECARAGITANAIAAGPVDTPMLRAALARGGDKLLKAMIAATLVERLGEADEVAAAVAFLASEAAGFITGEVLGVSGGMGCGA